MFDRKNPGSSARAEPAANGWASLKSATGLQTDDRLPSFLDWMARPLGDSDDNRTWWQRLYLKSEAERRDAAHRKRATIFAKFAIPVALVSYSIFLVQFALLGYTWMVVLDAISVCVYLLLIQVVRIGQIHLAFAITAIQLAVFTAVGTLLAGIDVGTWMWMFYVMVVAFAGYRWRLWFKLSLGLLAAGMTGLAVLYISANGSFYQLDDQLVNSLLNGNIVTMIVSSLAILYALNHSAEETEEAVYAAHLETRSLLLNILPESIADRLPSSPGLIADRVGEASILFSDLVGFSRLAGKRSAEEIVTMLNDIVSGFDTIVKEAGLEKIKTIGDGYMAAAGIPEEHPDHALRVVKCGMAMLSFINDYNAERRANIKLRVGAHSGPVVAGVIGRDRFSYDLWGDTVNTAARMESHGLPGRLQLSDATYALVKDFVVARKRSRIKIKGKGLMDTWLVTGAR